MTPVPDPRSRTSSLRARRTCWLHAGAAAAALVVLVPLAASADRGALAPGADPCPRQFLWTVTSPTTRVHLLGSIHLAKPDLYPLDPVIESAYDGAEGIVVEYDITRGDQTELQLFLLQSGLSPSGLHAEVSAETGRLLDRYLEERQIPPMLVVNMRPWLAGMTLSQMELVRLGFTPEHGIDMHFLRKAQADGKNVGELESADTYIKMISTLTGGLQEEYLRYTLKNADKISDIVDGLVASWKQGDLEAFEKLAFDLEDRPGTRKIFDAVIVDRNRSMADRIRTYLEGDAPQLVIVGAGHLVGDEGIPRLLQRAAGARLTVTQRHAVGTGEDLNLSCIQPAASR